MESEVKLVVTYKDDIYYRAAKGHVPKMLEREAYLLAKSGLFGTVGTLLYRSRTLRCIDSSFLCYAFRLPQH